MCESRKIYSTSFFFFYFFVHFLRTTRHWKVEKVGNSVTLFCFCFFRTPKFPGSLQTIRRRLAEYLFELQLLVELFVKYQSEISLNVSTFIENNSFLLLFS